MKDERSRPGAKSVPIPLSIKNMSMGVRKIKRISVGETRL